MSITRFGHWVAFTIVAGLACGCASAPEAPPPPPPTLEILTMTVRTGGTHHCTLLHDGRWYQSFDSRVLVLDPETGLTLHEVNLGRPGHSPPVVDMLIHGGSLFVVLEADTVLRLSLDVPEEPAVVEILDTKVLGVQPMRLSVADDRLFASGDGGVVDLSTRELTTRSGGVAGPVVAYSGGLATTAERRAVRLNDGELVGLATALIAIPQSFGLDGHLIGVRQRDTGALISLMTADVREVETETATIAVSGPLRAVRFFDDRMWVVNDEAIRACALTAEGISIERTIDVLGARDVARRDENHLLVAGCFGRAVYREESNDDGPGDEFTEVHREPSGLTNAVTDGRYLLAGGPIGHWRYLIGQPMAELNERRIAQPPEPQRSAQTATATVNLSEDGRVAEVEAGGVTWRHREPGDSQMHGVYAIDGNFWIGHDRGITVLRGRPVAAAAPVDPARPALAEPSRVLGRLRFEGPVRFIYPLATGRGGVFVSEFGGFGVAEFEAQVIEPEMIQDVDSES